MKRLGDYKVGDVVRIYLNGDGFTSTIPTEKTVTATILGYTPEDNACAEIYYLAWKYDDTENIPGNARRMDPTRISAKEKIKNYMDFHWRIIAYVDWEVAEMEEVTPVSLPEWKLFVNNQEGQCPCGTNRSACRYHG